MADWNRGPSLAVDNDTDPASDEPGAYAAGNSGGSGGPGIDSRLQSLDLAVSNLREAVNGVNRAQNIMISAVAIVGALFIALQVYTLTRIDNLPSEINRIADSITAAVTATGSAQNRQPIIINVPSMDFDKTTASPSLPSPQKPDVPRQ